MQFFAFLEIFKFSNIRRKRKLSKTRSRKFKKKLKIEGKWRFKKN